MELRERLKKIPEMFLYQRYIDNTLAEDFILDLFKYIDRVNTPKYETVEELQKEIDRNNIIIGNYLKHITEHTEYTLKIDKVIHEQQQEIERLKGIIDDLQPHNTNK